MPIIVFVWVPLTAVAGAGVFGAALLFLFAVSADRDMQKAATLPGQISMIGKPPGTICLTRNTFADVERELKKKKYSDLKFTQERARQFASRFGGYWLLYRTEVKILSPGEYATTVSVQTKGGPTCKVLSNHLDMSFFRWAIWKVFG